MFLSLACYLLFFASCVDTFDISISSSKKYLIIEGDITDIPDAAQRIRLFETDEKSKYISSKFTKTIFSPDSEDIPVSNAKIDLLVNGNPAYTYDEITPGKYELPNGAYGQVGNTYQLKILLSDGRTYHSSVEEMYAVPALKNFNIKYNEKGIQTPRLYNIPIPTHDFYVDFDDPENERNFYVWNWVDYEIQRYCESCKQGLYFRDDETATSDGRCIQNPSLNSRNFFEYECDGFCWEVFPAPNLQIFSDVFTNGKPQKDKLVAQIPVLQKNSCLVVIEQKSLSPGAYRYLKLIEDQSINTGSLADTPPAPIKGNVLNDRDEQEIVLGYFSASSVSEIRHMLSRADVAVPPDFLFERLNNRAPVLEEAGQFRQIVPLARCKFTDTTTPTAPRNWQFGQ